MGPGRARVGLVGVLVLLLFGFGCGESAGGGAGGVVGAGGATIGPQPMGGDAGRPSGSGGVTASGGTAGVSNEGLGGQRTLAQGGATGLAGAANDGGRGASAGGASVGGASVGGAGGLTQSCALVHHVEVPFPVRTSPAPFVVRSGSEFGVVAGNTLGALTWSGELARQAFAQEACANTTCDGLFGRTALRGDAGWRMLSADRVASGPSVRAWRMGDPSLPEARPLCGPEFSGLVSNFALQPSRDGRRALFANGHRVVTQALEFVLLDAEGGMVAPVQTLELPYKLWDSLTVVPTEHAATVSAVVESDDRTQRLWVLREVDAKGQIVFATQVSLPADYSCSYGGAGACAIVEDVDGYYIGLGSNSGPPRIGRVLRAQPDRLLIDENMVVPGALVGALSGTLVFRRDEYSDTAVQTNFVGLPKEGTADPRTLVVGPAIAQDLHLLRTQLISTEGDSIFYGYQTATSQIIEEVACPAEL